MSKEEYKPSPEEQAELEKSRTLSDAELLKDVKVKAKIEDVSEGIPKGAKGVQFGGGGVFVIEEGGKYIIQEGEKRLEISERQFAKARHEMLRSLGQEAMRNENLARINLKSIEGLPQYDLLSSMPEGKLYLRKEDYPHTPMCCTLNNALGSNADVGKFHDKQLAQKVLSAFYAEHPELNNSEKPFLLKGDFGTVVVKGDRMEYLP